MYVAATAFPTISTTGSVLELASGIPQGDAPTDRFSTQCVLNRLNLKFGIIPGTTSTTPSNVRITVLRGQSGLAFASNMTGSYNPIAYGTSTKLLWDTFLQVPATLATVGFPIAVNKSLRLGKHKQKFTSAAAGTSTGECLYCIIQSDKTAGTTAPVLVGTIEIYFDPT